MDMRKLMIQLVTTGIVCMILGTILGSMLTPTVVVDYTGDSTNMAQVFLIKWTGNLSTTFIKVMTVLALMFPAAVVVKRVMGFEKDPELRAQMLTPDNNDSPAIVTAGTLCALAILVAKLPFTGPLNYIAHLLFRGGYALLLAVLFAAILLWFRANVTRFDKIDEQIKLPGTDAIAIFISVAAIVAALLV